MQPQALSDSFTRLADSFNDSARLDAKPAHLAKDVADFQIQAGRMLHKATEGGAFDAYTRWTTVWKATRELLSHESSLHAPLDGDGNADVARLKARFARSAAVRFDGTEPSLARVLWRQCMASWLAIDFPELRFDATSWDHPKPKTDARGKPIDKDRKRPRVVEYGNGGGRHETPIADRSDFYDTPDAMYHLRSQAGVSAQACRLLAELCSSTPGQTLGQLAKSLPYTEELIHARQLQQEELTHALKLQSIRNASADDVGAGKGTGDQVAVSQGGQAGKEIPVRALKAGQQYVAGLKSLDCEKATDAEVYDQLVKDKVDADGELYDLPSPATWARNLRTFRGFTRTQENAPRGKRADTARSVCKQSEL